MLRKPDTWIWALVLLATASVVTLAVVQSRQAPGASSADTQKPRAAPRVELPLLEGRGRAGIQQGKITMVDFWATWCAPCRASMPRVQELWQEYLPAGVELYSVDTDDDGPDREPNVKEFLMKYRLSFPVVLDDGSAARAFDVSSLPTMLLLDRQGTVVWTHVGALTASREKELRASLDRVLKN